MIGAVLLLFVTGTCLASEPTCSCSPFEYEEKLLTKMIRQEFIFEKFKEDMLTLHKKVIDKLADVDNERDKYKSEMQNHAEEFQTLKGFSKDVAWNLCVDKCYYLSSSTVVFTGVDIYCKTLSPNARPVDFGAKNNDSMAMQLGSCGLKKQEAEPYWVNMKLSTSTTCRTIEFIGRSLFENQDFLCTQKAHPFCEADKSICENIAQQGNSGALSEWVAVDSTPPYYHISTGTYSYCDAVTYCENMQTHLSHIDVTDYMSLTKLHPALKPKAGENFIVWIFTSGIQCPTATANATVIAYVGAIVHMTPSKVTTEQHLALCDSPFIPTTTTTTTTQTISSKTSTTSTTKATTTTPTTSSTSSTTPTTTSTTTPTTTSTTPTTPSTTTTTPKTTSTTTPATTSTLIQTWTKNQIAVSENNEPLWLQTGDHEYFINYDCVKNKCPGSCSRAKQGDGKSFCESFIELFQVLPAPPNRVGKDFWIGGRASNIEILHDETIKFEKYNQRPVKYQLSQNEVQELWQELRKQRRSRRMSAPKP